MQIRFGLALLSLQTGALKDIVTLQHEDKGLDSKVRMNDSAIDAKG